MILEKNLVDRIGHGTFIHPDTGGNNNMKEFVIKNKLPLGKQLLINALI